MAAFVRTNQPSRFPLTDPILAETATRLPPVAGAARSAVIVGDLLASRRYELIFLDLELLKGALAQMERFADKRLSLTDCASFELMERLALDGVLTFDRDFRDCGFRMLP